MIAFVFTLAPCLYGQGQTYITKDINEPTTWTKKGSPYIITPENNQKHLSINKALIVEPGVIINVKPSTNISVYDKISVMGAKNDSVYISSINPNETWSGLIMLDTINECEFQYVCFTNYNQSIDITKKNKVVFKHCRFTGINSSEEAALYIHDSPTKCLVDSCLFDFNNYGIYCLRNDLQRANITIMNSKFYRNTATGISTNSSFISIINNSFLSNETGLKITIFENTTITGNIFKANKSGTKINSEIFQNSQFSCNYFYSNTMYDIECLLAGVGNRNTNVSFAYNYFGTPDTVEAHKKIYDASDNSSAHFKINITPALITDQKLSIKSSPSFSSCCKGSGFAFSATSNFDNATYTWYKNGKSLEGNASYKGATSPKLEIESAGEIHEGTFNCLVTVACQEQWSDTARFVLKRPYHLDSLCIATVSDNGKNVLLGWERTNGKGTMKYKVYREDLTNEFSYIGEIPFSKPGIFVDTSASINTRPYRYKITTVDSCTSELPLAEALSHKTMHLKTTKIDNKLELEWSLYEGVKLNGYNLLAGESYEDMDTIDRFGKDINTYTVENPGTLKYRIISLFPRVIDPSMLKSDGGPYSYSMSNISESQLTQGKETSGIEWYLYPNPTKAAFVCMASWAKQQKAAIRVTEEAGTVVKTIQLGKTSGVDTKITLHPGIYFVELSVGRVSEVRRVVVE